MKLNKMNKEELELLSYTDLTKMILDEKKKSLNTQAVFKEICTLLELTDDDYVNKIGDYYTALTTDKRFIFLEDGTWDLKDNHKVKIVLDDEDDSVDDDIEDITEETDEPDLEYDTIEEGVDEDDEEVEDEMEDLSIIDEDAIDEEEEK